VDRIGSSNGFFVVVVALTVTACADRVPSVGSGGADAGTDAGVSCKVSAPTMCPDPPVRYSDVSDIFGRRCVSCHYGAVGGPWPLLRYMHAADWYDVIQSKLLDCSMPPPESGIIMPTDERAAILTWVLCGILE
jgi:hypothetical protein